MTALLSSNRPTWERWSQTTQLLSISSLSSSSQQQYERIRRRGRRGGSEAEEKGGWVKPRDSLHNGWRYDLNIWKQPKTNKTNSLPKKQPKSQTTNHLIYQPRNQPCQPVNLFFAQVTSADEFVWIDSHNRLVEVINLFSSLYAFYMVDI